MPLDNDVGFRVPNLLNLLVLTVGQTWTRCCVYVAGREGEMKNQTDPVETRAYVKSVAMKYVRDESDAEDVTQDALLLAHRYRDSFRGESRYSTWLYRVTATAALMFLRKQRRRSREIPASGTVDDEGAPWIERQPAATDVRGDVMAREELGAIA